MERLTLYSIGHSNRSLEVFLDLLAEHGIGCVADVRAFPASRRWPHFGKEALAASLGARRIGYEWMPALGGRRPRRVADSPHVAWTVAAFRQYADYADTAEFTAGLDQLCALAAKRPTVFLCAEALYWQCHRRLIADHLVVAGHRVVHIEGAGRWSDHRLPDFARVVGGRIVYDGGTQLSLA